jgi:hypothetical protein
MNNVAVALATRLRGYGFEVDCFCDKTSGRYVFNFNEIFEIHGQHPEEWNAIRMLSEPQVKKAFKEDKKWLDWCDTCILLVPSGRSAHLEAGYAKGCGKKLYIFGEFPQGEWDVMYGLADGLYPFDHVLRLIGKLQED